MDKEIIGPISTEVTEQVRKIAGEDADDLAVMQYLMQASATAQLIRMRKLEESMVPIGIKPLKPTVTDTIMKLPIYPPWISLSLINGSGAALTLWVNDEQDPLEEAMIAASETYSLDMKYPVIHTLYLKAESGGTTIPRIYGKEGKPS